MSMSPRDRFWDIICGFRAYLRVLLLFVTTLLVLTVFSMLISDQQTDAYVISIVTATLLTGTLLPLSYCVWRCGQTTKEFESDRH